MVVEVVGQRLGPAYLRCPEPVEAGVDHHAVQPGGHGGVAAEGLGPSVGGHQAVLQAVGGVVAVAHRAYGDRPEPVAMPGEEQSERLGIAVDVGAEQGRVVGVGEIAHPRTLTSATWPMNPPGPGGARSATP